MPPLESLARDDVCVTVVGPFACSCIMQLGFSNHYSVQFFVTRRPPHPLAPDLHPNLSCRHFESTSADTQLDPRVFKQQGRSPARLPRNQPYRSIHSFSGQLHRRTPHRRTMATPFRSKKLTVFDSSIHHLEPPRTEYF